MSWPFPDTQNTVHHSITLSRNLQVDSFFPDELYQGYITGLPPGRWWTIQLPFRDMTLTRLGRLSYIQKELDSTFALESIGFLVADGKPGPFRLEIGGVKAVGKVEAVSYTHLTLPTICSV